MNKDLYELSYALKKEMQHKVTVFVFAVVAIYIFLNLILNFVIFPTRQISLSMDDEIPSQSCIMFSPLKKKYSRGDVVLIKSLDNEKMSFFEKLSARFVSFFTAQQIDISNFDDKMAKSMQVRRILGVPGDTIYMKDYVLYIKPKGEKYFLTEFELVKNQYNVNISTNSATWNNSIGVIGSFDEVALDKNEYFVLSDSRVGYVDSRLFGKVSKNDIKASAIFQYFPLNKLRFF